MQGKASTLNEMIFLPESKPYGESYGTWTQKWWLWLLAIPKNLNPAADTTGKYCAQNQTDRNAWFLAGTFGGRAKRSCIMSKAKGIFFPVINYVEFMSGRRAFKSDSELVAYVKKQSDDIKQIQVTIDGVQSSDLAKYRVPTAPFDVRLPNDNVFNIRSGANRAAGDGYWIFLKPLSIGNHAVSFSGIDPERGPDFETSVTYELRVE